jgi:hypothetical protein
MNQEKEEALTFHNENAVTRISLWANIIGITILVFSLISFFYQAYNLGNNWSQVAQGFRTRPFEVIAAFTGQVFLEPLKGVFYFLVLRGISQLLNLGLDLYYAGTEE